MTKKPRYELYGGTRYPDGLKAEACILKQAGRSLQEIRHMLGIQATKTTLIRWFKAGGVYEVQDHTRG